MSGTLSSVDFFGEFSEAYRTFRVELIKHILKKIKSIKNVCTSRRFGTVVEIVAPTVSEPFHSFHQIG